MSEIKFNASKKDVWLISSIVDRAMKSGVAAGRMSLHMDLTAAHLNGNRLRLEALLTADDFNFYHDVAGIMNNIDRTTGKLGNCFVPRFAKPRKPRWMTKEQWQAHQTRGKA